MTTHPQAWAIGASQDPPPSLPPPHREGKGQREGSREGGEERPKVAGIRPQGQGTRGETARAQKPPKGQEKGGHRGRGRKGGHQGAHTGRARHNGKTTTPPPPADTLRPTQARACQDAPPQHGPDAARAAPARFHRPPGPAQGTGGTPTRGEEATPTGRAAENAATQPTTTPSPPGDDPGHNKAHHTSNGTGTSGGTGHGRDTQDERRQGGRETGPDGTQHTRGGQDTPPHRTRHTSRGKGLQRTRDKGTGPQGGQPRGHPPNPPGRTAHPDPRNTDPTSHTAPNRAPQPPASHITSARVPHHEAGQSIQRRPHPTPGRQ